MTDEETCDDCDFVVTRDEFGFEHEWFVVHDAIWTAAGMPLDPEHEYNGEGILCVGCIERRLGRRLNVDDFAPLNVNVFAGRLATPRLRSRLQSLP